MMLFGKGLRCTRPLAGTPVRGSKIWYAAPTFSSAEKSPPFSASVGTVVSDAAGVFQRTFSQAKNQNMRFLPLNTFGTYTGPPAESPYWLYTVCARGRPLRFVKKFCAASFDT